MKTAYKIILFIIVTFSSQLSHAGVSKIYLSEYPGNRTFSADPDGSNLTTLTTATNGNFDIEIDQTNSKMYISAFSSNNISVANLDGTGLTTLWSASGPWGNAIDVANNKIYWTEYFSGRIMCANLDGTGSATSILTGLGSPAGLEIDVAAQELYFIERFPAQIRKASLASSCGSATVSGVLVSGFTGGYGIAIDPTNNKMYWSDFSGNRIGRSNLDGSSPNLNLYTSLSFPADLEIDPTGGEIYWQEYSGAVTKKANADGSTATPTTLLSSVMSNHWGIALAITSGPDVGISKTANITNFTRGDPITYTVTARNTGTTNLTGITVTDLFPADLTGITWTCTVTGVGTCSPSGSGNISDTIDLNAGAYATYTINATVSAFTPSTSISNTATISHPSDTYPGNDSATVITTIASSNCMYLSEYSGSNVYQAQQDGSNLTNISSTTSGGSFDLEFDQTNNKAYWPGYTAREIYEYDVGSATRTTIWNSSSVTGFPWGIAIDPGNNKIYWTDISASSIRCANLDGTGTVSTVLTGISGIRGVEFNSKTNELYFTEITTDTIRKGSIAGACGSLTGVTTVVTGLGNPYAVTIDETNAKIYWSEFSDNEIRRANLDGSSIELLFDASDGVSSPSELDYRAGSDEIFWSEYGSQRLRKGNGDGSGSPTEIISLGNINRNWGVDLCEGSDLEINKASSPNPFIIGDPGTYTITVTNNGPYDLTAITVLDNFPTGFTGATWTCSATGGSSCASPSGSGNINTTVDLLNGGVATFTVTGTIDSSAPDPIENSAALQHDNDSTPANDVSQNSTVVESPKRILIVLGGKTLVFPHKNFP